MAERIILMWPTESWKTHEALRTRSDRFLYLAPSDVQVVDAYAKYSIEGDWIATMWFRNYSNSTTMFAQYAMAHRVDLSRYETLIIDEAYHLTSGYYWKLLHNILVGAQRLWMNIVLITPKPTFYLNWFKVKKLPPRRKIIKLFRKEEDAWYFPVRTDNNQFCLDTIPATNHVNLKNDMRLGNKLEAYSNMFLSFNSNNASSSIIRWAHLKTNKLFVKRNMVDRLPDRLDDTNYWLSMVSPISKRLLVYAPCHLVRKNLKFKRVWNFAWDRSFSWNIFKPIKGLVALLRLASKSGIIVKENLELCAGGLGTTYSIWYCPRFLENGFQLDRQQVVNAIKRLKWQLTHTKLVNVLGSELELRF